ncbi:WhiB family transcriptional regulator [Serinicoccus kebangsaanensis]|uniref:WhiB family transcriptional regulator n=1 Tax=Serinicoccus kebangsaanensis TaxID=2602069 RepID=UPI00124ED72F|nr:WhiB family transcriptional regulator [Serinicoccus kebangsaanensis]
MSAQQVEQQDSSDRLTAELEAVAPPRDEQEPVPQPRDVTEVAALTDEERAAWLERTPPKRRWEALTSGDLPHRGARWHEQAQCQGSDVDLVDLATQTDARPHALALCARCPVLAECATEARQHPAHGLWAGVGLEFGKPAPTQHLPAGRPKATRPKVTDDEAIEWLRKALRKEEGTAAELRSAARDAGIFAKQLGRVADQLGARRGSGIPWRLPEGTEQQEQEQPPPAGRPQREERPCPSCWLTSCDCNAQPGPLPIDPAARTASEALLIPRRPAGRHRGQRTQPRKPRPRSRRRKAIR